VRSFEDGAPATRRTLEYLAKAYDRANGSPKAVITYQRAVITYQKVLNIPSGHSDL
jgi:hypothetical protein